MDFSRLCPRSVIISETPGTRRYGPSAVVPRATWQALRPEGRVSRRTESCHRHDAVPAVCTWACEGSGAPRGREVLLAPADSPPTKSSPAGSSETWGQAAGGRRRPSRCEQRTPGSPDTWTAHYQGGFLVALKVPGVPRGSEETRAHF